MLKRSIKALAKIAVYRIFNSTKYINESQVSQLILKNQYKQLASNNNLPKFQDTGCHFYSQTDEDGFLLFIFSLIDSTNKKVIEIGCGDGLECNSANLIINHGWKGLLLDGDEASIKVGQKVYGFLKTTAVNLPKLVHAWLTKENINEIITSHGFDGEIDLLSIDIDGIDYWILKSIDCVNPRVIILEYNTYWDVQDSVTVPYDSEFQAQIIDGAYYCGASLTAFVKLGAKLGYRLVGCNTARYNAFFVRNDIGTDVLPEVTIESCLNLDKNAPNKYNSPVVSKLSWEKV